VRNQDLEDLWTKYYLNNCTFTPVVKEYKSADKNEKRENIFERLTS